MVHLVAIERGEGEMGPRDASILVSIARDMAVVDATNTVFVVVVVIVLC